jgi:glycosyltransferase involved in cell wall biosynthesis
MALGLPCVVTDVGPMREFDGDGCTVHLVRVSQPNALANAIVSLIQDLGERQKLSLSGCSFAHRRFDYKTFSAEYAQAINGRND